MAPKIDDTSTSWYEYRRLVLDFMQRIDAELIQINVKIAAQENSRNDEISDMKVQIAMLKVQAAVWGAAAAIIMSGIVSLIVSLVIKR